MINILLLIKLGKLIYYSWIQEQGVQKALKNQN